MSSGNLWIELSWVSGFVGRPAPMNTPKCIYNEENGFLKVYAFVWVDNPNFMGQRESKFKGKSLKTLSLTTRAL